MVNSNLASLQNCSTDPNILITPCPDTRFNLSLLCRGGKQVGSSNYCQFHTSGKGALISGTGLRSDCVIRTFGQLDEQTADECHNDSIQASCCICTVSEMPPCQANSFTDSDRKLDLWEQENGDVLLVTGNFTVYVQLKLTIFAGPYFSFCPCTIMRSGVKWPDQMRPGHDSCLACFRQTWYVIAPATAD